MLTKVEFNNRQKAKAKKLGLQAEQVIMKLAEEANNDDIKASWTIYIISIYILSNLKFYIYKIEKTIFWLFRIQLFNWIIE